MIYSAAPRHTMGVERTNQPCVSYAAPAPATIPTSAPATITTSAPANIPTSAPLNTSASATIHTFAPATITSSTHMQGSTMS